MQILETFNLDEKIMIINSRLVEIDSMIMKLYKIEMKTDLNSDYLKWTRIDNALTTYRNEKRKISKLRYELFKND